MPASHEITNQPPPLHAYDMYGTNSALVEAVNTYAPTLLQQELHELGQLAGTAESQEWARLANENEPRLRTHDRYSNRIDEVEFHPAWHELMRVAVGHGLTASPWLDAIGSGAHVRRAAQMITWGQVEQGHLCPIVMTYAAVPAMRADKELADAWESLLGSKTYDFALRPAPEKLGAIAGMGMTEKQGGSDVRANTTTATPTGDGSWYSLTGHKWFCSAPMSDVFLVLAQAPGGLTCFVLPRVLPGGSRNVFRIQRLKDKLGNRSNASAEIELEGSLAQRLGEEGRGVRTIVEMVAATRLDCILGSSAIMRQAVAQAIHHTTYRHAFGSALIEKPLMRNVLADLAVESEAATWLAIRLATAVDNGEDELRRIGVAVGKFWVCKRTVALTGEALECLGGNGYVEESGMPRLYREAPLNSVWEGSGNVNALDVLRAVQREPVSLDALLAELGEVRGADRRYDAALTDLLQSLADLSDLEFRARRVVVRMATLLQGSLLLRHSDAAVADAFCASRLDGDGGLVFGTLPHGVDAASIVQRASPNS